MSIWLAFVASRKFVIVSIILSIMLMSPKSGLIGLNFSANRAAWSGGGAALWHSIVVRDDGCLIKGFPEVLLDCILKVAISFSRALSMINICKGIFASVILPVFVSKAKLVVRSWSSKHLEQSHLHITLRHWAITHSSASESFTSPKAAMILTFSFSDYFTTVLFAFHIAQ